MNARIVTQERTLLGEWTIVGLRTVKDAVKFHDPENCRPEKIPLTDGLLTALRSAHMHRKRLDEEEAEKKKRHAEEKLKRWKERARDQIVERKGREPRQKGAGGNGRNANS